jgi:hypothetical protein
MGSPSGPDGGERRGSPTYRYPPRERAFEPAAEEDADARDATERHIARHFGPIATVWHELISDLVHIDVHVLEPSEARPFYTLVTSGMSDRAMTVPPEAASSRYAEVMLCLPADWPMFEERFEQQNSYWPVALLKTVARLPHEYNTWIGAWHSVPNDDPAVPYAEDTPFVGVLVAPMLHCEPSARTVVTDAGKEIALLALVPLHPAELALKLSHGTDALLDAFRKVKVSEVLDPARPSSV